VSLWRRVYEERRPVVLPLVAFLAANIAVFALGVLPLRQSVAGDAAARDAAQLALARARLADLAARKERARKEQADAELKKFYGDVLPANASAAINLVSFWLQQTAETSGLQFKSSQAAPEAIRDSRLTRMTSTVTLDGDYANIRRFLYAVETAPQFVVIERVRLAESSGAQDAAAGGLELIVDISTYYLTPAEAGAGTP
jgi:Tfp pilus assembly protein PilO